MPVKGKKSLTINEETQHKIAVAAKAARRSIYDLVDEVWQFWEQHQSKETSIIKSDEPAVAQKTPEIPAPAPRYRENALVESEKSEEGAESKWVSELLYILRHGDEDTIDAITRNLNRFALLTRVIQGEAAARGEINRIARQIAEDPKRRVDLIRKLTARYHPGGAGARPHEIKAPKRKTQHSDKIAGGS